MAKRAGGSRASRPRAGRAARTARAQPASEVAREEVLAAEAADEIATNTANVTPASVDAVQDEIEEHIENPDQDTGQPERNWHAEAVIANLASAVRLLQKFVQQYESVERPFVRVVGRILYRLTVDGERESCTAKPIAVALLLFLREHLDPEHRQAGTNRDAIDVNEPNLQGLLYDRLDRLTAGEWEMARQSPGSHGYQLTEDGRFLFRDWPDGIDFNPRNEDLWRNKRPGVRGGGRPPTPEAER